MRAENPTIGNFCRNHFFIAFRIAHLETLLSPIASPEKKRDTILQFEDKCKEVKHSFCVCCRKVGINITLNRKRMCSACAKHKDENFLLNENALPVWYLNKVPQYHVPEELSCLTLAECMLIQLNSPFIPLQHIKQGVFGICGHAVAFEQDVEEFVNTLPRGRKDVTMLNVLKVVKAEIGNSDDANVTSSFRVRKSAVGNALRWLKQYNEEYKHIKIDMRALDWLEGNEGTLDAYDLSDQNEVNVLDGTITEQSADLGPSPNLTRASELSGSSVNAFGYVDETANPTVSPGDAEVHNTMVETIKKSDKEDRPTVQWPRCGPVPINEFSAQRLFARAYPWLFPGGIGDLQDFPGQNLSEWGKNMIYYQDGRFTKDKFFCFFALNYITRRRNASSGNWFIKDFNHGGPKTLDDLKSEIEKDKNFSFINRLNYYNRNIKGSTQFWHSKRQELYTWINHHVEKGNGAPSFFITLSCCEHYWADIVRLLKERLELAGEDPSQCFVGSPKMSQILNDYAIVVQEYFQKRVEIWLKTVGKEVFEISHYWVRYEFAPGRGQIHAHLLAITKDKILKKLCHLDLQQTNGKERRDRRLSAYAKEKLGLSATVCDGFDDIEITPSESPCTLRFADVSQTKESISNDQQNLLNFCQVHNCSKFCLQKDKHKK